MRQRPHQAKIQTKASSSLRGTNFSYALTYPVTLLIFTSELILKTRIYKFPITPQKKKRTNKKLKIMKKVPVVLGVRRKTVIFHSINKILTEKQQGSRRILEVVHSTPTKIGPLGIYYPLNTELEKLASSNGHLG